MKKFLALLLTALLVFSLAACGAPAQNQGDAGEIPADDAFGANLKSIVEAYNGFLGTLSETMQAYDGSADWWTAYAALYNSSGEITDQMTTLADVVPAPYQEAYAGIVLAMAAYTDAMATLAAGIDSTDPAEQQAIFEGSTDLFTAAGELWVSSAEALNNVAVG